MSGWSFTLRISLLASGRSNVSSCRAWTWWSSEGIPAGTHRNTSCNANTFKWWKCVFVCVHTYSVQSGRWTGVCVSAEGLAALWWKASTDWKRPPVSAQTSQIPHSTCLILYEGTASKQRGGQRDSREKDTENQTKTGRYYTQRDIDTHRQTYSVFQNAKSHFKVCQGVCPSFVRTNVEFRQSQNLETNTT